MSRRQVGFTLLEIMLVLAIFALLSLLANRLLLQGVMLEKTVSRHAQRLMRIQHVFTLLERDTLAMLPRPVRGGALSGAALSATESRQSADGMVLTHAGWFNPADSLPRPRLQRVGYRLQEEILLREYSNNPDVPSGATLQRQQLLTGVKGLRIRYWHQGGWQRQWQQHETLPQGLEVTLVLSEGDEITRRFLLPGLQ